MATLYNLELEQNYIAGILKHPDLYVETDYIKVSDFSKQNGDILGVIQNIIETGGHPTPVVIADKCNNLSISMDGIDIKDFCESLIIRAQSMERNGIYSIAREIKKKSFSRKVIANCDKLKKEITDNQNAPAKDLVKLLDKYLGESLINFAHEEKTATNLLEVIPDIIEEMGNKPDESPYIHMPYKTWEDVFGPLRPGQLYFLIARQGGSKSTVLLDIMRELNEANPDKPNLKILYLDTEMRVDPDAAVRYIAGKIGVPYWLIDSRQWRKDTKWAPLIKKELKRIRETKEKNLYFHQIGNMSGSEMDKFIKNWYLTECGRGNPCVIIYDYLKINTKDKNEAQSQKEYEIAYDKTEVLKDCAEYCNAPIISAIQGNKAADIFGKNGPDDSSGAASISDRIGWLAALMLILRPRLPDEIFQDSFPGMEASSHKLIHLKQRYLGREGPEFLKYVKVKYRDGNNKEKIKYEKNYININIDNFRVTDMGTYTSWLAKGGKTKDGAATEAPPVEQNAI